LCRFPAVFTALADIVLGWVLTYRLVANSTQLRAFACLLLASAGLYLSGMVFNDLFDREQDSRERPGRPIPSGAVSVRSAAVFGGVLMLLGLTSAACAGRGSLEVAILLAACVLSYDGGLKRTPIGPVIMGSCRFLNVLLGASGGLSSVMSIPITPHVWVASGLGLYVAGITWFARTEAKESSRHQLGGAMLLINFGLATLIAWALRWPGGGDQTASLFLLLIIVLTINRRLTAAIAQPEPKLVQAAVKTMILSIITLDATMIYVRGGQDLFAYAVAVVLLLIPTVLLSMWIKVT
jgi:4-hydroxybenzoate polyprenyltransferase